MNRTVFRSAGSVSAYTASAALTIALLAFAPLPTAGAEPDSGGKITEPPSKSKSDQSAPPYYADCQQALRMGKYPLLIGQPGYRPGLDDDGNGVACD